MSLGKRTIDAVLSFASLVLLFPFLAIIAILVRCTSKGPALYWQERVGRGGRTFEIAKFRTMFLGADRNGLHITTSGDARITRLGVILRKFKIDELPQLWNVLKGDMSLVGPRPELPEYVTDYSPEQRMVLSVRPGITDIASIHYRNEEEVLGQSENPEEFYRNAVLPHKLALNLQYIERISLFSDLKLISKTVRALLIPPSSTQDR